jgi:hypothetical protein
MTPNSVYTGAGVRITIDIDDRKNGLQNALVSVTWYSGCQYNNNNMPDAVALFAVSMAPAILRSF